ncbi:MAG: MarR family transcriptional regulator [Hyphomonadaceae bacterium]|nr:MarR family transcriptional regulator [Hyphomonadaceae bacterium]
MPAGRKSPPKSRKSRSHERFGGLAEQVRFGKDSSPLATSGIRDSIGFMLRVASGVAQTRFGARLDKLGLRQSLFSVLLIIDEEPGLKQQEVGQTLSIQQPNLVALINELVQRGLVARSVNSEDRRSYSLTLTPAGQTLLRQANSAHTENEQALAKALGSLSVSEFRAALVRILGMAPPKGK